MRQELALINEANGKMEQNRLITKVKAHTPAAAAGVQPGEYLIAVNGRGFSDIIDLSYLLAQERLLLLFSSASGAEHSVMVEKRIDQDAGLEFAGAVFDGIKQCRNACLFCFVDQLAHGMRASLYIKDDDYRLSFLYGNFITFTNFTPADEQRIIDFHLSPLYVSVQATDETVRRQLLRNRQAGELLPIMRRLAENGIQFHTQVVLCPDINDGYILEKTFRDLFALKNTVISMAVVPVGLTKYHPQDAISVFSDTKARDIVKTVYGWQKKCRAKTGRNFIYLADEFYLQADMPFPAAEEYDGFPQYENGVGIARKFIDEWTAEKIKTGAKPRKSYVVCAVSAKKILLPLLKEINAYTGANHQLLPIENTFFGKTVTVNGLLTGCDIMAEILSLPEMPGRLILPGIALRRPENDFLDGMTLAELKENISCDIKIADNAAQLKNFLFN